jgi:hypothetical protein
LHNEELCDWLGVVMIATSTPLRLSVFRIWEPSLIQNSWNQHRCVAHSGADNRRNEVSSVGTRHGAKPYGFVGPWNKTGSALERVDHTLKSHRSRLLQWATRIVVIGKQGFQKFDRITVGKTQGFEKNYLKLSGM